MIEKPNYQQSTAAGQVAQDTTLRDILAVVFRRKWLILGIFGVALLLVAVQQFTAPVSYSADATLLLNRQGARSSVLERSGRVLPWTEVIESELEVVRSAPVMQRAQERLAEPSPSHPGGIHLNPRQISRKITAGIIGESNVLFVTGSDPDPDVAIAVTNAVARSYVEYHEELYELPDASGTIRIQADSTLALLERAESRRARLLEAVGVNEVGGEERALVSQRERLRSQLSTIERDLARLDVELEDARKFVAGESSSVPFYENTGSVQGNALSTSSMNLMRKRGELSVLREKYTPEHPLVRSMASEVRALEEEVRDRTTKIIESREHQRRALAGERSELRSQLADISATLTALPEVVREIQVLDTQIDALSKQYSQLSEQAVTSDINRTSFAEYSVKILSPAIDATTGRRADVIRLLLAPTLALVFAVFLAFYLENLDHSIANREDVERHVNIPVLASFPETRVDSSGGPRTTGSGASIPFRRRGSGRM